MPVASAMKLLFCSDLHGDAPNYARLQAAAAELRPDLIILGGDMLPDDTALAPSKMGHNQPRYVRETFRPMIARLREAAGGARVLFVFGNHDWGSSVTAVAELADEKLLTVLNLETPTEVNGVLFVGYPHTPPTPWYVKDFERLDEIGDRPPLLGGAKWDPRFSRVLTHGAAVLFSKLPTIEDDLSELTAPPDPWVFVAHAPQFGCAHDRTYGNNAYGSHAIRRTIEQHQPLLSLHGHIHESPRVSGEFKQQFGKTISVNVGQGLCSLSYASIEIDVPACKVTKLEHRQQT